MQECPSGKTSTGNPDASGDDATCDATICGTNEGLSSYACKECPCRKTSTGNYDASGGDTTCNATSCGTDEEVVNHAHRPRRCCWELRCKCKCNARRPRRDGPCQGNSYIGLGQQYRGHLRESDHARSSGHAVHSCLRNHCSMQLLGRQAVFWL